MRKVYRRLERWRSKRTGRARIPESLWAAAGELAREHGVNQVSRVLASGVQSSQANGGIQRPDRSEERRAMPAFVELIAPTNGRRADMHRSSWKGSAATCESNGRERPAELASFQPGIVGDDLLIQITPQLRILVAIEAIDGRKGIDSLAQLCREKLDADPFSGCLFIFRSRSAKSIRILAYDGQGFWLATKRLSKGRFRWWPTGREASKTLRAHQAQLLLAAGNPETEAAPVWRQVSL